MEPTETVRETQAIFAAEQAVEPFVGVLDTSRCENSDSVYRIALRQLGHDTKGLDGRAVRAIFDVVKGNGPRRTMGTDPQQIEGMRQRFPGAFRLKSGF